MTDLYEILESGGRLFLAILFGAAVGWEREAQRKPAGLRTHMMVCLGAASVALAALQLSQGTQYVTDEVRLDPIRVLEAVMGGIGFLGAGSIIQARGSVAGITTASSIWVAGAIGIACGLGYYAIAGITVLFAIIILAVVGVLEEKVFEQE